MISVALCDPHPIVQEGLRALLEPSEDFELTSVAETLDEAVLQMERRRPEIVIVDRAFGMHPLLHWLERVRQVAPDGEIVVWAASITDVECFRVLQAGAKGIVRKTATTAALFHCLRSVSRRQIWTENLFLSKDSALGRPRNRPLTPREQEVAALVAKGMKNREIAEALNIATGTVKIHLMHIFEKTGIRDRFELALQGLRLATERDRMREQTTAEGAAEMTIERFSKSDRA